MKVTREEILKVAKLAKLNLNEADIQRYQERLEDLLEFIDVLNKDKESLLCDYKDKSDSDKSFNRIDELFEDDDTTRARNQIFGASKAFQQGETNV